MPVKTNKPLKKLEKIPHTYFASIPTLGRITLRAVRSVMDAVQQSCTGKALSEATEEQAKVGKKSAKADKIYLVANHRGIDSFYGFDGLAL